MWALRPSAFILLPFGSPGSPWRVRFHVQRRKPRDQRRNYKTRCGAWNKCKIFDFASAKCGLELDFGRHRRKSSRMKILVLFTALTLLLPATRGATPASAGANVAEDEIRRLSTEEVNAFLKNDRSAMARLWSDDFVVTNPLNKLVTKQQVLGMVDSGFLVITSFDRQIEYLRVYGDMVIVAGGEAVVWGGRMPNAGKSENAARIVRRIFRESLYRRRRQICGRAALRKSARHCAHVSCTFRVVETFSAQRSTDRSGICRAGYKRESRRKFLIQRLESL